jgi:hypothetical protein
MHPRIEEVINYLDAERTALRAAVELIPPALRDKSPGTDRWSVGQVLQHLAIIERRIGLSLTKWIAHARQGGVGLEKETSSIMNSLPLELLADRSKPRTAPEEVRPPSDVEASSAWAAVEKSRETLRAAILGADGLALSEVVQPHPMLGPINLYQWVLFVGGHEIRHTRQVLEIAAELNAGANAAAAS